MTTEEFNQIIKRHQTLKEYAQAFNFCLTNIKNPEFQTAAADIGKRLIKEQAYDVMQQDGKRRVITVPLELSVEWIIDTAISLGYTSLERGSISTGFFSSCPCVTIGSMLAKQKFGIRYNKDKTSTLIYTAGSFAGDFKLVKALCSSIIDLLTAR